VTAGDRGMHLGVRTRPLDRKREKALLAEHRTRLVEELGVGTPGGWRRRLFFLFFFLFCFFFKACFS
jgi:hypothetical protein